MSHLFLQGQERAIILFHAYTGSTADVRMLGEMLHRLNYTVYMPLFSGHGTKDIRNVLKHSVDDWVRESMEAVRFLEMKGYKEIAVFGLSMGGMLAIRLLTEKMSTIIAGGSFNSPVPLSDASLVQSAFVGFANKLYTEQMGDKSTYDTYIEKGASHQLGAIQEMTENMLSKLSNIECPVYIAQSGQDELISPNSGHMLANAMPFASVDYHYFPTATHVITVGKDRQQFNESVIHFIETLNWGTL